MTELNKLNMSVQRVIKAFRGLYRLQDIVDSVSELEDTLSKTISGKFAGIAIKDQIQHLIRRIKSVQSDISELPFVMQYERDGHDRTATLRGLTLLKSNLLKIKELSFSILAEINEKSGGILVTLRSRIDHVIKDIEKYVNEVRAWK